MKKERMIKIFEFVGKTFAVTILLGFFVTRGIFPLFLDKDFNYIVGTVKELGEFENGGYAYRYDYIVNNVIHTGSSFPTDPRHPPKIGSTCMVKYLPWYPDVAKAEF